jgi:hypothetical protein
VRGEGTTFQELKAELLEIFRRGVDTALTEDEFNDLALRAYRYQLETNGLYRAFAGRRLGDPFRVGRWEEIPFLPSRAFKVAPIISGGETDVEVVFRTSGTTGGVGDRGAHHVRSLELYRGSLVPNFQAHLLPEGEPLPILALLPSPAEAPESSLSFMVGEMAGGGSGFFLHPEGGVRVEDFRSSLLSAQERGDPLLLAGTAFAFVHWLEVAGERGWGFPLPPDTRILETGGYKGRVRVLPRRDLYESLSEHFGVPQERMVNEYGMTELLSQFYEPILAWGGGGRIPSLEERFHRVPPWVRTQVLNPLTLEPLGEGEVGVLAHLDLANLGSVCAVLTEDLGTLVPGGFRLRGRTPGAEPRGCSLAMEDFLAAGGRGGE